MVEVITTDEFNAWYESLDISQAETVNKTVTQLESEGTQLGFPASSALNNTRYRLRELRVKASGDQIRIAYIFDARRDAVLLLGAAKVGDDRFYDWFIPQAEKIWEQYCQEQGMKP